MSRSLEIGDWEPHERALFAIDPDKDSLVKFVEDKFPKNAELIRQAGASMLVATTFERTFAGPWGIIVVVSTWDKPFAVVVYSDKLAMDRDLVLKDTATAELITSAGIAFWRVFAERLGGSLSKSPAPGGGH